MPLRLVVNIEHNNRQKWRKKGEKRKQKIALLIFIYSVLQRKPKVAFKYAICQLRPSSNATINCTLFSLNKQRQFATVLLSNSISLLDLRTSPSATPQQTLFVYEVTSRYAFNYWRRRWPDYWGKIEIAHSFKFFGCGFYMLDVKLKS